LAKHRRPRTALPGRPCTARHRHPRTARQGRAVAACGLAMAAAFGCSVTSPGDSSTPRPTSAEQSVPTPFVVIAGPGPTGFPFESDAHEVWAFPGEPSAAESGPAEPPVGEDAQVRPPGLAPPPRDRTNPGVAAPPRAPVSPVAPSPPAAPSAPPSPAPAPAPPPTVAPPPPSPSPSIAPPTPPALLARLDRIVATAEADGTISPGLGQALSAKLDQASAALSRTDGAVSACGSLGAFVNLVQAQEGKGIPVALADQLHRLASQAMGLLSCR